MFSLNYFLFSALGPDIVPSLRVQLPTYNVILLESTVGPTPVTKLCLYFGYTLPFFLRMELIDMCEDFGLFFQ